MSWDGDSSAIAHYHGHLIEARKEMESHLKEFSKGRINAQGVMESLKYLTKVSFILGLHGELEHYEPIIQFIIDNIDGTFYWRSHAANKTN